MFLLKIGNAIGGIFNDCRDVADVICGMVNDPTKDYRVYTWTANARFWDIYKDGNIRCICYNEGEDIKQGNSINIPNKTLLAKIEVMDALNRQYYETIYKNGPWQIDIATQKGEVRFLVKCNKDKTNMVTPVINENGVIKSKFTLSKTVKDKIERIYDGLEKIKEYMD